jgi:hypothetical protein
MEDGARARGGAVVTRETCVRSPRDIARQACTTGNRQVNQVLRQGVCSGQRAAGSGHRVAGIGFWPLVELHEPYVRYG